MRSLRCCREWDDGYEIARGVRLHCIETQRPLEYVKMPPPNDDKKAA